MTFATHGERLARRALRTEDRQGIPHYVTGQHDTFTDDGVTYLTYVNVHGHVMSIPCIRSPTGWTLVGVYQEAGPEVTWPIARLPQDFALSPTMLTTLEASL